jgi:S-adenosylmethionine decarboxylase
MSEVFAHFICDANEIYVGNHLIADLWGITNHHDQTSIMDTFTDACKDAGATVLFSHCHPFGPDSGTTGVIVLAESHLSWHHYPEVNMISIDIFMCGTANPSLAMKRIKDFWMPHHIMSKP